MLKIALKLIKTIEEHGYTAYIIGGFVRDYLLGITSNDIDICTNARPSDIRNIFPNSCLPNEAYGSVTVIIKNIRFEITTFRREIKYINNRKPIEFEYIDDLMEDLKRRDFTINTICMDKDGNIIDLLDGKVDLKKREINTVGDSINKFTEDSLRILRAVRFAASLNFTLNSELKLAIGKTKGYVKNLSYNRKKEELTKIFGSVNVRYGVKLLIELGLDKELELNNLRNIKNFEDLLGIWAQLNVEDTYPFTKNERGLMESIRKVLKLDSLDAITLYHYGLYVCSVVADMKGLDRKIVTRSYNMLPIKCRSDIVMSGNDIMKLLNHKPGNYLNVILKDIETKILKNELKNEKASIESYILEYYQNIEN